jgi:hypothetical protein
MQVRRATAAAVVAVAGASCLFGCSPSQGSMAGPGQPYDLVVTNHDTQFTIHVYVADAVDRYLDPWDLDRTDLGSVPPGGTAHLWVKPQRIYLTIESDDDDAPPDQEGETKFSPYKPTVVDYYP